MLLVLGRPGAGCTTLLRVMAEMRKGFTSVEGDVTYGGIDSREFGKTFRGEVCYNEEEDINYPTLTTKQTLQFALRLKTPGKRLQGQSKKDFINNVLYMLGNMLGLTKQMDTMVGNEFVRGLSGGERKRLCIAEVMTTQSSIVCKILSLIKIDFLTVLLLLGFMGLFNAWSRCLFCLGLCAFPSYYDRYLEKDHSCNFVSGL